MEAFSRSRSGSIAKKLKNSKNNEERNKIQVVRMNSGLTDWKEEIEDVSEQEKEKENPNGIVDFVEMILEFNLKQQEQALKISTSNQMLCSLPISLAQLKAGYNSEKLKNETGHILDSLYRSKILTKNIYKSLIDII